MLTKEQLQIIINKSQTNKLNVFREYAQHLFLSSLYRTKGSEKLLFKGGTAYRIAYKSPRFSEDLDFSTSEINFKQIEELVLKALGDLENIGFKISIEESKKTTGGYLAKLNILIYEENVLISIQISLREKTKSENNVVDILNEYIPTYQAILLSERIMIGEKIQASLTRSKPRDFYDIYFLLKNGFLTNSEKDKLVQVKKVLLNSNIKFKGELSNFLPMSMKALADNFPKLLLSEIDKFF
ncbi:MAG: nucleotidyl transferase AbiEii/AbiGii toxin family protein [Candidatus Subteraquimicrobiales bacterium]|nr:nucleotidyl transferase AbiEii/AbiGii toxin family protein [Candidatus Subteraquimicrobiales bacterium]